MVMLASWEPHAGPRAGALPASDCQRHVSVTKRPRSPEIRDGAWEMSSRCGLGHQAVGALLLVRGACSEPEDVTRTGLRAKPAR